MASLGELGRLTDEESADLLNRVERFQIAWKADGSTGLEWYLPPPGTRHRHAVLVQIIVTDMERRAPAGLPFRVERYVNLFPEELSTATMPVPMLATEYRLRHRFTDRPQIAEYHRWFPDQFDELLACLSQVTPLAPAGSSEHTSVTAVNALPAVFEPNTTPGVQKLGTLHDGRRPNSPAAPTRASSLLVTGPVDPSALAAANAANVAAQADRSARVESPSRILPDGVLPSDTPYQLVRRIGSGAFGEVFEALAPGGVKVAVKRILRSVDHPASQSEKESLEAIKWLAHPFLLKTNAYWVFDDKLVIVMELADGSLTDRITYHQERGLPGVPPEELVSFFEQAGEALDYLHSQNISHRDIKPENLLVLKGYAKVADFGLARLHEHTMTMVPTTVGTPAYMAPEMWQQKVSLQSDQYSLAATYVRARIGRHLYETNVLVDMANFHINGTPNLDPLPKAEQAVLLKALAKKPEDRYGSCLEFAKALRAAVFPPPPLPPQPVREGGMGPRALVVVAIACALASALAVGLVIRAMLPEQQTKVEPTPPDLGKGTTPPKKEPPPKVFASYPPGWLPVSESEADVHPKPIDGKYFHRKLIHESRNPLLTANLIYTDGTADKPFYMLEYKITNKVFDTAWKEVCARRPSVVMKVTEAGLAPGLWRKDDEERPLAIDVADADLPVLGVTLPEAMLVAEQLGGKIPLFWHWQKATGVLEPDVTVGPAGPPLKPPQAFDRTYLSRDEKIKLAEWKRGQYRKLHLALGLQKPLPVRDQGAAGDVSKPWKIRQLVSNGQEWLAQTSTTSPDRLTLFPLPPGAQYAAVVGSMANLDLDISTVAELTSNGPRSQLWGEVKGVHAGFRLIIEPLP